MPTPPFPGAMLRVAPFSPATWNAATRPYISTDPQPNGSANFVRPVQSPIDCRCVALLALDLLEKSIVSPACGYGRQKREFFLFVPLRSCQSTIALPTSHPVTRLPVLL